MKSAIKLIIIYLMRLLMKILHIFPIKENRIICNAYRGMQYAGNPKYLSEYISQKYSLEYEIIWAFKTPKKFAYLSDRGIKLVKYSSIKRFYYEATAKISINNIGSFSWLPLRKGQEHVNTWHGGFGVKKCGLDESANNKIMKRTIQMSTDNTTNLISTSEEFDRDIAVKDLGFKRTTLKIGYPRNDILFKQKNGEIDLRDKVCESLGINSGSYIVLYAPTWRYNRKYKWTSIDYNSLKSIIGEKTGREVAILYRMHHLMESNMGSERFTIDATDYPDMQELLAVSDCLISDYSSCIWDYSIMGKPIYLYTPDVDEYDKERGSHVRIYDWGFPVCRTNQELFEAIMCMSSVRGANWQKSSKLLMALMKMVWHVSDFGTTF